MKTAIWVCAGGMVLASAGSAVAAPRTSFTYTGVGGSYIADGVTSFNESPATGWAFSASASTDHTYVELDCDGPAAPGGYGPTGFTFWLKSPTGRTLTDGSFPNATRYPFEAATVPGFWLFGNGRGDNNVSGYFNVLDADFGTGGTLNRFAVQFRQYDEGSTTAYVDGLWLYNTPVPEPAAAGAAVAAVVALASRRRRRRSA